MPCTNKYDALTCRDRSWIVIEDDPSEPLLDELVRGGLMRSKEHKWMDKTIRTYFVTAKGKRWLDKERDRIAQLMARIKKHRKGE